MFSSRKQTLQALLCMAENMNLFSQLHKTFWGIYLNERINICCDLVGSTRNVQIRSEMRATLAFAQVAHEFAHVCVAFATLFSIEMPLAPF